ncbi:Gfo/Idh/MocA family protein [uncultured Pseudokineococcus sp.]|uniref:Gfo/Idh/MocA family protein n=1 Tax=uncultured Pseudokineococcus sp. TaxID=1642928 RepID=UPI0026341482|nr:Gfo/Idh/MocA family oxidoreductase [uncultured Pseudokineococcus sp.]
MSLPDTAPAPAVSGDLRVAVIGVGLMGADHVARLHQRTSGARVVVVNDFVAAKAAEVAAGVPGARAVDDPFAAISAEDVDAVVIASPGPTHGDLVLACLEAGKPVLCEKPLTTDSASALAVVRAEDELAERTGRRLVQLGFMRRFDAEYVALKDLVDSGDLGEPLLVHCAHRNADVPPHFDSVMMINDSVVHEVDVARFLLDEEVTAVTALRPRASRHAVEGASDPMLVLLETASGRLVDVEIFVRTGVAYEVRTEVVCEDGSATIGRDSGLVRHQTVAGEGLRSERLTPGFRERFGPAYDTEVQRWVDAARRGEVDGPGVWDGYAAVAVCEAGVESVRTGARVEVRLADRSAVGAPA